MFASSSVLYVGLNKSDNQTSVKVTPYYPISPSIIVPEIAFLYQANSMKMEDVNIHYEVRNLFYS